MVSGKSVVVTGAASGIGRACAKRLVEDGNRVVAVDLDRDRLEQELGQRRHWGSEPSTIAREEMGRAMKTPRRDSLENT